MYFHLHKRSANTWTYAPVLTKFTQGPTGPSCVLLAHLNDCFRAFVGAAHPFAYNRPTLLLQHFICNGFLYLIFFCEFALCHAACHIICAQTVYFFLSGSIHCLCSQFAIALLCHTLRVASHHPPPSTIILLLRLITPLLSAYSRRLGSK